ncbi:ADAMTS-like protein 2 [Diadema antillarum]|uniref:ADAMTS-like protein 2 n=1 Tax=Diadema antillarum TaxID=105358 RepID=UPI003A85E7FA
MLLGLMNWCLLAILYNRRQPLSTLAICLTYSAVWHPDQRCHRVLAAPSLGELWRSDRGAGGGDYGDGVPQIQRGVPLSYNSREPVPQGIFHWSEYRAWSPCTATCGTGVEGRRRVCRDERGYEVSADLCQGRPQEYRLCRIQNCPYSTAFGYRASRCQEIAPPGHTWRPYYPSEREGYGPCTLACYNEANRGEVRVMEHDVPLGTRCVRFNMGVPETGVCINGACWSIGCDGYLNSTKSTDGCGVCGGDGTTCSRLFDQIIVENLQVGYTDVLQIPPGATNIAISETYSIRNYLALSTLNGEYLLNGHWTVHSEVPYSFWALGSRIRYHRQTLFNAQRQQWDDVETISLKGPTNDTLLVQILNFVYDANTTVRYEYVIPLEVSTAAPGPVSREPTFNHPTVSELLFSTENPVESLDEQGNVETRKQHTSNITYASLKGDIFSGTNKMDHRPDVMDEPLTWHVQDSIQNRTQYSMRNASNSLGDESDHSRIPASAGLLEAVNASRGVDEHSSQNEDRTHTLHRDEGNSRGFDYDKYSARRPNNSRDANSTSNNRVPDQVWGNSPGMQGGGWPMGWAEVAALETTGNDRIFEEEDLDLSSLTHPVGRDEATDRRSEERVGTAEVEGLQYGPPYRTDGSRRQSDTDRTVIEVTTLQTSTEELDIYLGDIDDPIVNPHEGDNKIDFESEGPDDIDDDSESDYERDFYSSEIDNEVRYTTKPQSGRRVTERVRITTSTTTTTTTELMTTMITASETALMTSLAPTTTADVTSEMMTTAMTTEMTTEMATTTTPPPEFFWRITDTMPCSATCTRGIIRNYAYCVDVDEEQVVDTMCDPDTKPDVIAKECSGRPCEPRWEVGTWSNCVGDCKASFRFRTVHCWLMMGQGLDTSVPNERCNQTNKPNVTTPCDEQICGPQWVVSDWSQCSTPCGQGQETRQVTCSETSGCDMSQRPARSRTCNKGECSWSMSSWSRCPRACGIQARSVLCVAESTNAVMEDRDCRISDKPLTRQLCGGNSCQPHWVPQAWQQCEGDCRSAFRRRDIICAGINGDNRMTVYPNSHCVHKPQPVTQARCMKASCPQRRAPDWVSYSWKPCSVTCGTGLQSRTVQCLVSGRLSDRCDLRTRPPSQRECSRPACTSQGITNLGPSNQSCQDNRTADCNLIVQADLCRFSRYSQTCCRSCRNIAGRSGARGRK